MTAPWVSHHRHSAAGSSLLALLSSKQRTRRQELHLLLPTAGTAFSCRSCAGYGPELCLSRAESRLGKSVSPVWSQFEILSRGKAKLTWKKKNKIIRALKYLQLRLGFVCFSNSLNQTTEGTGGGKELSCAAG